MKTNLLLSCFLVIILFSCQKAPPKSELPTQKDFSPTLDSLDTKLIGYESTKHLPGFVVALFDQDSIFFAKGYGYANIEDQKAYNINTIQGIASISKTFIAVALMKAVEQELIDLDDEINDYLNFDIINPYFPDETITIRHLATHTAGLNDEHHYDKSTIFSLPLKAENWRAVWHRLIEKYNTNVSMPMDGFLENIFSKDGDWYSKDNFLDHRPGTYYEYSNLGAALVAQIIENAAKVNFKTFTKNEIFIPLGMDNTGWSRNDLDTINHIAYYNDNDQAVPPYSLISYPDGGLFSNTTDLITFLQEMMKGLGGKSDFLSPASFQEMMSSQSKLLDTNTGLFWDLDQGCCIGHGGNDIGIASMMYLDKRDGIGRIVLSNIDVQQEHQEDAFYGIFNELFIEF